MKISLASVPKCFFDTVNFSGPLRPCAQEGELKPYQTVVYMSAFAAATHTPNSSAA